MDGMALVKEKANGDVRVDQLVSNSAVELAKVSSFVIGQSDDNTIVDALYTSRVNQKRGMTYSFRIVIEFFQW